MWSVCYADVPDDETVEDLARHLGGIVAENLFGSERTGSTFNEKLEAELLVQDGPGIFKQELSTLLEGADTTTTTSGGGDDNSTSSAQSAGPANRFVDELADGEITPDMIPDSVKSTPSYREALQRASVNVLVSAAVEEFPTSSGCTNPVNIYQDDQAGKFFSSVPYPNGPSSYYLFQCLR